MSDATAAILAALVGAIVALTVGALAFAAAMKQVNKTALAQREQAFWDHRRNTYANYLDALSTFWELVNNDSQRPPSDDELSDTRAALSKIRRAWDLLVLEEREERGAIWRAAGDLEDLCAFCFENLEEWARAAHVHGLHDLSRYVTRRDEYTEHIASSVAEIRDVLRKELHRSISV
ncbi:hypothetical protein ABZ281_10950 [Streptomyces sp. NPDC006265]|uniref:hypothetical protein n=1 Tax=Streptomyces sp. NPDC006265 TaxID=3156740 RepID=UPI0033A69E87